MNVTTASPSKVKTAWPLNLPAGSLVGVLESPARIPEALAGLNGAGIERRSVEIISRIDGDLRSNSPASILTNWLTRVGPDRELSERYKKEVSAGGALLVIRGLPSELQALAAEILRASGGRCIHVYGRFTIRTLAP
jgi:hypothetical protein